MSNENKDWIDEGFAELHNKGLLNREPSFMAKVIRSHQPTPPLESEHKKDAPCFICGKQTSSIAGNPALWPHWFCYPNGNGKTQCYCEGCVMDMLNPPPVPQDVRELIYDIAFELGIESVTDGKCDIIAAKFTAREQKQNEKVVRLLEQACEDTKQLTPILRYETRLAVTQLLAELKEGK